MQSGFLGRVLGFVFRWIQWRKLANKNGNNRLALLALVDVLSFLGGWFCVSLREIEKPDGFGMIASCHR